MKAQASPVSAPVAPQARKDRVEWRPVRRAPEYGSDIWLRRAGLLGLIGAVLIGFVIPVACHRMLEGANVSSPAKGEGWMAICAGTSLGVVGGILLWLYLCIIDRRPHWLLYFILTLWPVVEWGNLYLLAGCGTNLHLRPLLLLLLGLPACWLVCCRWRQLLPRICFLKYYALFVGWVALYFAVRNAESASPGLVQHATYVEGSQQLATYFHCLFGGIIAAAAVFAGQSTEALFDRLNRALLAFSSLVAIGTMAGAAAGLFTAKIEGIERVCGIFTHPNPFAHHQGVLLVYFLGLHWYYTATGGSRVSGWLVGCAISVHLAAFLMALSKSAIISFALAGVFIVLAYLLFTPRWVWAFKVTAASSVLGLVGVAAVLGHADALAAQDIRTRIGEHGTFEWRVAAWDYVKQDLDVDHLPLGHGLTASSYRMYEFADRRDSRPLAMVHNGYLAILYDFGLPGCLMFAAAAATMWQAWRLLPRRAGKASAALPATVIALMIYFLVVCGVDEIACMFDATILVWTLASLLVAMAVAEAEA